MPRSNRIVRTRLRYGRHSRRPRYSSADNAMNSDAHHWGVCYFLLHSWFRVNCHRRGRYGADTGMSNALFHDIEQVRHALCAVVVFAVTHVPLQFASKPLEMVKDGGRHQYWSTLVWYRSQTVHDAHHPGTSPSGFDFTCISYSICLITPPPKIPSDAFVTDAEIKHGRVALVSGALLTALAFAGLEHPSTALAHSSIETQIEFFSAIGIAEAATYLPRFSSMFSLRDDAVPGKFIPGVNTTPGLTRIELNVSRCAMRFLLPVV